jgi:pimeloyl-ACP methyl ester carboxylesterase
VAATGLDPSSFDRNHFESRDGTRLGYQSVGSGDTVVLANGLGGTFGAWRHLYQHLAARYRVVSWDYRCFHSSGVPQDPHAVDMPHQVDDLEDLLAHLGVTRSVLLGWSMGTQVILELYRRHPARVAGLGLINGTAGQPFSTVRAPALLRHLLPLLAREIGRQRVLVNGIVRRTTAWAGFIGTLKRVRLVSAALDEVAFRDLAGDFGRLDFGHYMETMLRLSEHDAWDVLPTVKVPTTVIVGDHDYFTPLDVARRIAGAVRGARLVVIPDGTHYTPLENPDAVNGAVDDLLARCRF